MQTHTWTHFHYECMQIYVHLHTCSWIEVKISKLKRCVLPDLPNYETDALFMNCNEAAVYETSHCTSHIVPWSQMLGREKSMFTCVCSSCQQHSGRQLLALWLREFYPQRTWGQTSAKVNFTHQQQLKLFRSISRSAWVMYKRNRSLQEVR